VQSKSLCRAVSFGGSEGLLQPDQREIVLAGPALFGVIHASAARLRRYLDPSPVDFIGDKSFLSMNSRARLDKGIDDVSGLFDDRMSPVEPEENESFHLFYLRL